LQYPLAELILSGFNLVWLSLLASAGLLFGNLAVYYFSKTGSQHIPEKYEGIIAHLIEWTERAPTNDISQVAE